ncbi:MAG: SwmB domain-containing protein, partial [Bacteroidales bacterium]
MKKILVLIVIALYSCLLTAQIVLTREGEVINNTVTGSWPGVNIPRSAPTKLSFLNNSITSVNASGYLLQAGDETPLSTNNNLNGAVITGNRLTWNGSDASSITHGMFMGYNINYTVKYNYLDKTPYGLLFKSGTDAGVNMTYSSGYGAAYNIVKNARMSLRMKGINGVQVYNNTFYSNKQSGSVIFIDANNDRTDPAPSTGAKIKNNIFYTVYQMNNIAIESGCLSNFESDYNVFYCESGTPMFSVGGSSKTFAQWQAMGYDLHSVVVNPNFINTTDFVPKARLNNGTNLGTTWQKGLSTSAKWVAGSSPATTNQNGTWQAGAVIYPEVTTPVPPAPVYVSSAIENATPSVLEIVYSLSLAAAVPSSSAFAVRVNSVARNINSVAVSGTKVLLTLASPVVNKDVVTVAYTKPATNPLQTAAGGQAATLSAQSVLNKVNPVIVNPAFVSAAIANATPARIDIVYSLSLASVVPAASAFAVKVNSVARTVNSVSVSGTSVLLTLASPVVNGDVVTVAYTKPSTNPLQTSAGGQAATLSAQSVL